MLEDLIAILFNRLPPDFRPGTGAEPAGEFFADLDLDV